MADLTPLRKALAQSQATLLAERLPHGAWRGELSSSALSTATALTALHLGSDLTGPEGRSRIAKGATWLAAHQNADGGWGDTVRSESNISTTILCWAALHLVPSCPESNAVIQKAALWLTAQAGATDPGILVNALLKRYGSDRTFSVPILTLCAITGRLGPDPWKHVLQLPFELAACPPSWFAALRLPVVSYALPALIAIGLVRHRHRPSRNPLLRGIRNSLTPRVLAVLEKIQPSSGGFLEATPLTSFVAMSLLHAGRHELPVVRRCLEFLVRSARADGSWAIDSDLETWLTSLSLEALGPAISNLLPPADRTKLLEGFLAQQYRTLHTYTNSPPGGWAWTPLPGGVPDADDTAGALLALKTLEPQPSPDTRNAAVLGIQWLLNLQNRDGGIPTFCRGWGKLPFDRSSPDLTAHALRAWHAWLPDLTELRAAIIPASLRARTYLCRSQDKEGFWTPLWFGNQHHPSEENPLYGSSRVLLALAALPDSDASCQPAVERGLAWVQSLQRPDGSWSSAANGPSSIEETAWAVEALAAWHGHATEGFPELRTPIQRGALWLATRLDANPIPPAAPVGFYFAKLWYFERLYPLIFSSAALRRAAEALEPVNRVNRSAGPFSTSQRPGARQTG